MLREPKIDGEVSHMVAYDLRDDDAVQSLHAERACLQGLSDIEATDNDHFVLVVYAEVTSEVSYEHE